jgi:hypothetical protein
MPAQERSGRDEPMSADRWREQPSERGEECSVFSVQRGLRVGPSQNRDLVPKDQQFGVFGGRRAGEKRDPTEHSGEDQVE